MFTTSLLPLPPPSNSLLPMLSQSTSETTQQLQLHHSQARRKTTNRFATPLTTLSHDERIIASRKLAIAMYGYSWLKPAGCTKTMLGRREEELEREEVERQLREVELQERMAMEQEEQERREELRRQAEGGEVEGVGERDLDDEVPEAGEDGEGDDGSEDLDGGEDEEEDMEGDLDDDIPEADTTGQESSWVYDTRRESDTESEEETSSENVIQINRRLPRGDNLPPQHRGRLLLTDDPDATDAIVNAMLNEDELGDYEHQQDLDDEVPDMDQDLDMDVDMDADLSDEVPDADANSDDEEGPGWEHTDSELEESEMDISLLPPHPNSTSRSPGTTHEEMRRTSGNRMLPPPLPVPSSTRQPRPQRWPDHRQSQLQTQPQPQPRTAPRRNLRAMMQTPTTDDEVSALISSTGGTDVPTAPGGAGMGPGMTADGQQDSVEPRSPNRRSWLNPAAARRNLFAGFRGGPSSASLNNTGQAVAAAQSQPRNPTVMGIRSGGLFTPSPRQVVATGSPSSGDGHDESDDDNHDEDDNNGHAARRQVPEQPQSRTRSGRLLSGFSQVGRRARRAREGET